MSLSMDSYSYDVFISYRRKDGKVLVLKQRLARKWVSSLGAKPTDA